MYNLLLALAISSLVSGNTRKRNRKWGVLLSYRDYLEAQKKYIRTKKEAREAKRDREQNPRPPRVDPPPAPMSPWALLLIAFVLVIPLITLFFVLPQSLIPAQSIYDGLLIWFLGTESEYLDIKNWLEPEILANDLHSKWTVLHATDRYDLVEMLRSGDGDLLIIQDDFAQDLYSGQGLAPLLDKWEGATWENCFAPFWQAQSFQKTYGWAIPVTGNIEEARHLVTVMRQFALPFRPEKPIVLSP
ncbi:MAG TPA: hypothetical protein VJZ70_02110 [Limnochordia bacterium]|nr:hypothetical protein [Limnochordia bacterium]